MAWLSEAVLPTQSVGNVTLYWCAANGGTYRVTQVSVGPPLLYIPNFKLLEPGWGGALQASLLPCGSSLHSLLLTHVGRPSMWRSSGSSCLGRQ